ncbi:MAG TPA: integration host factor subunit beta [Candidatus Binatia bacterium]|nr:integration host factor subunit beta [Candidatus Binatia bacterium]
MTKRELIEEVVNTRSHLPRREVEALVNGVFGSLTDALARGERIEIRGFGSFIVKRRNAREGLNPKTGEVVSVNAKRVAFFKAGKELKQRVDRRPLSFDQTAVAAAGAAAAPARASLDGASAASGRGLDGARASGEK